MRDGVCFCSVRLLCPSCDGHPAGWGAGLGFRGSAGQPDTGVGPSAPCPWRATRAGLAPVQYTAYNMRLSRPAALVGKTPPCLPVANPAAGGPPLPPSDSSELTAARCRDGAPEATTGHSSSEGKRMGFLLQDCPRREQEAAQGEVDRHFAGRVNPPASLFRPAHNTLCHACRRHKGAGGWCGLCAPSCGVLVQRSGCPPWEWADDCPTLAMGGVSWSASLP